MDFFGPDASDFANVRALNHDWLLRLRDPRTGLETGRGLGLSTDGKNLRVPIPEQELRDCLTGARVVDVRRRAKYLLIDFDNGMVMIVHPGETQGHHGIRSDGRNPRRLPKQRKRQTRRQADP